MIGREPTKCVITSVTFGAWPWQATRFFVGGLTLLLAEDVALHTAGQRSLSMETQIITTRDTMDI